MMRKLIASVLIILLSPVCWGQILHPADWTFSVSKVNPTVGDTVNLIFSAEIDEGWYLYSSDFDPELGPLVTEFNFEINEDYELIGSIKPQSPKSKYDSLWEGTYTYFVHKGQFIQTIIVRKEQPTVSGSSFYQTCSDADGRCIPFDEDFDFTQLLQGKTPSTIVEEQDSITSNTGSTTTNEALSEEPKSNSSYTLLGIIIAVLLIGLIAILIRRSSRNK